MSVTRSSSLSLRVLRILCVALGLSLGWAEVGAQGVPSGVVPSQANVDASAQRRLQETAREAQRLRRIEEQVQKVSPAVSPENLSGPEGAVLARKALAALVRLQQEGISPDDSLRRAVRSSGIDPARTAKPMAYLRNLHAETSGKIPPELLARLEAGQDPGPALSLPAYQP